MTVQEFKLHLDAAEKSPEKIAAAVIGVPQQVLNYKPAPDKWSVLEILAHLADTEIVYGYRIRQILADKDPTLAPIDQDAWARQLGYNEVQVPEMIALYSLIRRANLRVLRRLRPEDLEKSGFHPEYNRQLKLAELVERMAAHGPNHLQQIQGLKKQAAAM
jgi:DinB superfamily